MVFFVPDKRHSLLIDAYSAFAFYRNYCNQLLQLGFGYHARF